MSENICPDFYFLYKKIKIIALISDDTFLPTVSGTKINCWCVTGVSVMSWKSRWLLWNTLKGVIWKSSPTPAGVHHVSQIAAEATDWGIPTMRPMQATLPYQLAGSQGKFTPIGWWGIPLSFHWLFEEPYDKSMQIVSMWQLKSLSAEQPPHWKAEREREWGGRKRGSEDSMHFY